MGGSQSGVVSSEVSRRNARFQSMFRNNFALAHEQVQQLFGTVELYRNVNTSNIEIMLKLITYSEEQDVHKLIKQLERRILHPVTHLLSIYHVQVDEMDAYCGNSTRLKVYAEYQGRSLLEEVRRHRKARNGYFSEQVCQTVWKVLMSLARAVAHMHGERLYHGEITLSSIMIDENYYLKVVERSLLNRTNWQIEFSKEVVRLTRGRGILFSPIILKCLFHRKTQLAMYDPFKADIFAVGMIMLECASLKKAEDFYDYDKFVAKMDDIRQTLYELRKRYSQELINLMEKILEQEDDDRPSASALQQSINNIPSTTVRQLNMTLNDTHLNQSIRSYM